MLNKSTEQFSKETSPLINGELQNKRADTLNNSRLENIQMEQLTNGILKVEFKLNDILYCGSVFSQDLNKQNASNARALYDCSEPFKNQSKGLKKKRKHAGRNKPRRIATNSNCRFRTGRSFAALSAKIYRELDELSSQEGLTPPEFKPDIKENAEINSPLNSNGKNSGNEEIVNLAEPNVSLSVKNFFKDINSGIKKEDDQFSDISDASKESPVNNSHFAIEDLCGPPKKVCPEPYPLNIPNPVSNQNIPSNIPDPRVLWQNMSQMGFHNNFPAQTTDNYTILKESRELNHTCAAIKSGTRFNMVPNPIPDMRPPFFVSNCKNQNRGPAPEQFMPRQNRPASASSMEHLQNNAQRLTNQQNDFAKLCQSFYNQQSNLSNPMGNINPALLAAMYPPFFIFPRAPQNPGSNSQGMPNMSAEAMNSYGNMMRPYNFFPQMVPRFSQPNSNPRQPGNSTMNGPNIFPRD